MTNSMTAYVGTDASLAGKRSAKATIFQRISNYFARRRVIAQTIWELSNCSDRELNDLGIARANIKAIAYQCVED